MCGTLDDPRRLVTTYTELRPDVVVIEPIMGPRVPLRPRAEVDRGLPRRPRARAHRRTDPRDGGGVPRARVPRRGKPKTCSVAALGKRSEPSRPGNDICTPAIACAADPPAERRVVTRHQGAQRELTVLSRVAEGLTNMEIGVEPASPPTR
ncbi:MAG: hypothetical protein R2713_10305 [Ilumatobacteraceae bacterium]